MSDNSGDYIFAAILVGIIFFPIVYIIWMFSSVRNFFISWAMLPVIILSLNWLIN
jgi:hypothetical protein